MAGALPPVAHAPRTASPGAPSRTAYAADVDLVARTVVASALIGSAVIHGMVAGDHFAEWVPAGIFFVAVQVVELVLALVAVYAWSGWAARAVAVTGIGTVAVWLVSRTVGMPIGPPDFRLPEAVGAPDVACGLLELMSVIAALVALRLLRSGAAGAGRPMSGGTRRGRLLATAVVGAAVALTVGGGLPTLTGSAHHHAGAASASRP